MDLINRQAAIDVVNSETVSTNPDLFKSSKKFISFMDDSDISSFGNWQWSNGFNTALTAVEIDLKKLPSAHPEPCKDTVSRQRLLSDLKELVAAWKKYPVMAEQIKGVEVAIGYVEAIPSAQPEPSQVARDIATIIENEKDMRVIAAQPEIIRCKDCKYAEVADARDNQDGYTCQFHRGSIWFSGSYCSWAERRTDE